MTDPYLAKLLDLVMKRVDQRLGQAPTQRWGVVQSVDPASHTVRVTVEPEHSSSVAAGGPPVLTGWLPVLTPFSGPNQGTAALPSQGQQVFVSPEYGDAEHGVVVGSAYSTTDTPPSVPGAPGGAATRAGPGEPLTVGPGGSVVRQNRDGSVYIRGGTIYLEGNVQVHGNLSVTGTLTVAGDVRVSGEVYDADGAIHRLAG